MRWEIETSSRGLENGSQASRLAFLNLIPARVGDRALFPTLKIGNLLPRRKVPGEIDGYKQILAKRLGATSKAFSLWTPM